MSNFLWPHGLQHQASLSFTISWSLLKLMSIESLMLSNQLILCHPLLLLPSIFPSTRVFSNELALCIRWPKYWSFSFSISHCNEYSALISFRIDWLDLLAVQGTHKNLLQHHSSKALILRHSFFFMFQLSHPYMTTGKTIALAIQTLVGKVMSLLFNTLSVHWLVQRISADSRAKGLSLVVWHQALGHLGQEDSGPDCENLIKEVVGSMGFESFDFLMKDELQVSCLLSIGIRLPWEGCLSWVSKSPRCQRIKNT